MPDQEIQNKPMKLLVARSQLMKPNEEQPERALYPAVGPPVTGGAVGVQCESVGLGSGQRSWWSLLWWE